MNIIGIGLKNFKTYKNLNIHCNEKFNVIIGPNNIGKSTLIEAILLWKSAFDIFIQDKNRKKFYVGYKDRYLPFKDIFFLRATDDSDIFFGNNIKASVKLVFSIDDEILEMEFNIEKPKGIKNSYYKVNYNNSIESFNKFSELMEKRDVNLVNSIFIYQTKPVSQVIKEEPFYNDAQLMKKISLAKSHELLRNKILKTQQRSGALVNERFKVLEDKLLQVLEKKYSIRCKNRNTNDDEYVKITIKEEDSKEVEISLMGSGFLQVIEIFSTLEFINKSPKCLNLILVDEPDSHIHSNLQVNLIDELKRQDNYQSFLISHNDRLIEKIPEGELLYINEEIKKKGVLKHSPIESYEIIQQELASKISSLKVEKNKKCFVLTEDEKTDLIEQYLVHNNFILNDTEIISYFGCDSINSAIGIAKYIKSLNEESNIIIHRDRDYLDESDIDDIKSKVSKSGFNIYVTKGVDIESEYINSQHIHFLYPGLEKAKIDELIKEATKVSKRDSVDRLLKKKGEKKELGIKILDLYDNNVERYRYGKKVLGVLKGLIQKEIKSNPDLLGYSEFIKNPILSEIANTIWFSEIEIENN